MLVDRLLAERGVDVNKADGAGNTPLIAACCRGMYPEVVKSLLARQDIEVNAGNGDGATALIEAARLGHAEIVDILVSEYVSFSWKNHARLGGRITNNLGVTSEFLDLI